MTEITEFPELKPGTYALFLSIETGQTVTVGKLGTFFFSPGTYVYVGSAFGPGGLRSRLGRHLQVTKKSRWHIDYLRQVAKLDEIWISTAKDRLECKWAEIFPLMKTARMPVKGFGSSDCACNSHLFFFSKKPSITFLRKKAGGTIKRIRVNAEMVRG